MKILVASIVLIGFLASIALAQKCLDDAKVVSPMLSEETRKTFETRLAEARTQFETKADADAYIWLGRRTAYLGDYKEAIRIFSEGIGKFPSDMRFLRHRGHRYITLRCFDKALADLSKAADAIDKKRIPDDVEPDGLPNARNIPTGTLHTNIWYHLGLVQYLTGDFNRSAASFMRCYNLAKNSDMRVAAANWVYLSAARYGREDSGKGLLDREIKDGLDIIENEDYYTLIKLYKGKTSPDELLKKLGDGSNSLSNATLGYGLGNWYLIAGNRAKAMETFRRITSGNQWASFGYIAAEAELKR